MVGLARPRPPRRAHARRADPRPPHGARPRRRPAPTTTRSASGRGESAKPRGTATILRSERDSAERQLGDARLRAPRPSAPSRRRERTRATTTRAAWRAKGSPSGQRSHSRASSPPVTPRSNGRAIASPPPSPPRAEARRLALRRPQGPPPRPRPLRLRARLAQATPSSHAKVAPRRPARRPHPRRRSGQGPGRAPSSAPSSMAARSIPIASSSSREDTSPAEGTRTPSTPSARSIPAPAAASCRSDVRRARRPTPIRLLASSPAVPGRSAKAPDRTTGLRPPRPGPSSWTSPPTTSTFPPSSASNWALDRYPGALVVRVARQSRSRARAGARRGGSRAGSPPSSARDPRRCVPSARARRVDRATLTSPVAALGARRAPFASRRRVACHANGARGEEETQRNVGKRKPMAHHSLNRGHREHRLRRSPRAPHLR